MESIAGDRRRGLRPTTLPKVLLFLLLSAAAPSLGRAAEIRGVIFDDLVRLNGVELQVRGVAVLRWALFLEVYAGALYLPPTTPNSDWSEDVAKRLELSYFRPIQGEDFSRASRQLLKRNLTAAKYRRIEVRLQTFCRWFEDVQPGDRYSITYRPGRGTELRLNGEVLGSVPGADFGAVYFGIWLGADPISARFRDRLLAAE